MRFFIISSILSLLIFIGVAEWLSHVSDYDAREVISVIGLSSAVIFCISVFGSIVCGIAKLFEGD